MLHNHERVFTATHSNRTDTWMMTGSAMQYDDTEGERMMKTLHCEKCVTVRVREVGQRQRLSHRTNKSFAPASIQSG